MRLKFIATIFFLLLPALTMIAQNDDTVPPQELADPEGFFVDVNGIEVYAISQGNPENPAVLLLHGFGGSTFSWRENMTALEDAGYYAIAFDRPPYGLADKDPSVIAYTPTAYAELTDGLMDVLNIESAHLIGHSAGGRVIAEVATTYPERIDSLTFVAGAVRVPIDDDNINTESTPDPDSDGSPIGNLAGFAANLDPENPLAAGLVRNFVTPDVFINLLSSAYDPSFDVTDEIAEGYQRVLRVQGWERAFIMLFAMSPETVDEPFDYEALAEIDVPILIMWGENDTWVPIDVGLRLQAFFGDAELLTFSGVGHLPQEENPQEFNTGLIVFLDALSE